MDAPVPSRAAHAPTALGRRGEEAAAAEAERRGGRILARNVRIRSGEIDLVWEDRGTIAFAEVKTRSAEGYGSGAEAVTPLKQSRMRRAAAWWLAQRFPRAVEPPCRFDVVEITWRDGASPRITWIEHAFE